MERKDEILFRDELYHVILIEKEEIFSPSTFGLTPIWKDSSFFDCNCSYEVNEYHLILRQLEVCVDNGYRSVLQTEPVFSKQIEGRDYMMYSPLQHNLDYTGAMIIVKDVVDEKYIVDSIVPCYAYRKVLELVFSDGILVTTIDHSRAMKRVRLNLDYGFRDITNRRDIKCIRKFICESFVGDYSRFVKGKRKWGIRGRNR
jgi:hypothetical protein